MDSLTHALTGALIGSTAGRGRLGFKALAIGAVSANIPDLDVLFTPFFDPVTAMFVHRGFSHSLLLLVFGSAAVALLVHHMLKKQISFKQSWLLVFFPWLSHLLMDVFNTYGTGLFEPFSSTRFSIDSMAIVDLSLLIILTVAFALVIINRNRLVKLPIAYGALLFTVLYFTLGVGLKFRLEDKVKEQLAKAEIPFSRIHTTPLPLTNLAWMVVVEDSANFRVTQVNLLSKKIFKHTSLPKKTDMPVVCPQTIERLALFTHGFYTVEQDNHGNIYVNDLRFSSLEQSFPQAFVLRFRINTDSCVVSRAHPKRGINVENIRTLLVELSN